MVLTRKISSLIFTTIRRAKPCALTRWQSTQSELQLDRFVPQCAEVDEFQLKELQQLLSASSRLVILTGAGVSTESGIPGKLIFIMFVRGEVVNHSLHVHSCTSNSRIPLTCTTVFSYRKSAIMFKARSGLRIGSSYRPKMILTTILFFRVSDIISSPQNQP